MKGCDICPLLINQKMGDNNVLLQTENWVIVLDTNQEYLGKAFVTLRRHKETISDLSELDWQDLHKVMKRYESAVKKAFSADVINWSCLMNNAVASKQPTHVHWHAHPRYLGGAVFSGEEFPDSKWPLRREKLIHEVSVDVYTEIADELRKFL